MIAYLRGKIKHKSEKYLILENQGIGYKIYVGKNILSTVQGNQDVDFFVYHNIKEDAQDLFGFQTIADLELFEKLISVSGVGPKTGLAVFDTASADEIKTAIFNQDSALLKKVSGIGAKTADRIVLELKNKIAGLSSENVQIAEQMSQNSDAISALISLGYSVNDAREALNNISSEITEMSEKVKQALKYLAK